MKKKTKKKNFWVYVAIYFVVTSVIWGVLTSIFSFINEDFLLALSLIIATAIYAFIIIRNKKTKKEHVDVLTLINASIEFEITAKKSTDFEEFIFFYNQALNCLDKLKVYENKNLFNGETPSLKYDRLVVEKNWQIRDAMERHFKRIVSDSKRKYKNYQEQVKLLCEEFAQIIADYSEQYDSETKLFSESLLRKLPYPQLSPVEESGTRKKTFESFSLSLVDSMNGHDFEYWCADLLRKNGFENVEVTPGSGDQGVDIIAEKDDIRYAVQCKCYSNDLGNTPIQEVNTGKTIYHCQIGAVMTNRHFTKGAVSAAEATGVLLWDRDKIQSMINASESRK